MQKKILSAALSAAMLLTQAAPVQILAADAAAPGATAGINTNTEYAAPYTVTFVYEDIDASRTAQSVSVSGNFQWYKLDDPVVTSFVETGDASGAVIYDAFEYEEGMFNTGYGLNGDMKVYDMTCTGGERFEITLPVPGNLYYYDYTVTYDDGETVTLQDPANPSPANPANDHDAGHSLVYVGSAENTTPGQEAIYARTDGKTGTTSFEAYTAVDGSEQYLEVYLPYGYDASKEYKTIYISHGGGGQEAEWMSIGAAANIADNLIAQGDIEPVILVTMDNTYFKWNYETIDQNFRENIIPFVESHFAAGKDRSDRALCGLSMGSMTTTTIMQSDPTLFGYYGGFSGANVPVEMDDVVALDEAVIYLTAGNVDMALQSSNANKSNKTVAMSEKLTALGIDHGYDLKAGAHDWGVWRAALTTFLKDYVTQDMQEGDYIEGATVEANHVAPENPADYQVTFKYTDQDPDKTVTGVSVSGNLQWYKLDDPVVTSFIETGSAEGAVIYDAWHYEEGMFNTGYGLNNDMQVYELENKGGETFELTIPVPGNLYYYDYTLTYDDGESVTIKDPANLPASNPANGNDAGHSLVYVGNTNSTTTGQEAIYARTDGKVGTTEFRKYTAVDGTEQYLEIYLPYGYNPENTYKTVYVSHGGGGQEAEWMSIGAAANIADNLIADQKVDPVILVTMDNTYFGWDFDQIYENFTSSIIPFVEKNYAAGTDRFDRALCGLSMGSMTTCAIMQQHPETFGYYGAFSGGNLRVDVTDAAVLDEALIYLTAGSVDMALQSSDEDKSIKTVGQAARFDELGIDYVMDTKPGAHDWGVWRYALTTFLQDIVSQDQPSAYAPGATVEANTIAPESDADYQITFVYEDKDPDKTAISVQVGGNLQWYRNTVDAWNYYKTKDASMLKAYNAWEYKDGMFNTGYGLNSDMAKYDMTKTGNERFEVTIPVPGNLYYYDYYVMYDDGSEEAVTVKDPANLSESNPANGHDAGHSLVYVGDAENTAAGQEYIYPRTDGKTGTIEYAEYTALDGSAQPLGIYLPYGYDASKAYKTVYISHGAGGQEADWMTIGAAGNIADNLIAQGEMEPVIIVSMDHTYFKWNQEDINANFKNCLIPFMEANYAVSKAREDRAMSGLSMGAITTCNLMQTSPELFGSYGIYSLGAADVEITDLETLKDSVIYISAGVIDFGINGALEQAQKLDDNGIDYGLDIKMGAHDWGVWRATLTTFLKHYAFKTPNKAAHFIDVLKDMWYYHYVYDAADLGLMTGLNGYEFGPNDEMTRAMMVTVIWRAMGCPEASAPADFNDVKANLWYSKAIAWAQENGIVTGYEGELEGTFGTNDPITREQLCTIIGRMMGAENVDQDLSSFTDAAKVSPFAQDGVKYCVQNGIISGTEDGKLEPNRAATRAENAKIFVNSYSLLTGK